MHIKLLLLDLPVGEINIVYKITFQNLQNTFNTFNQALHIRKDIGPLLWQITIMYMWIIIT